MRWFVSFGTLLVPGCSALGADQAQAVVQEHDLSRHKQGTEWVTTGLASRAHSDVQVRRLMKMFAAKKIDIEVLYERLEHLKHRQGRR